jgi:hypothetical protein
MNLKNPNGLSTTNILTPTSNYGRPPGNNPAFTLKARGLAKGLASG